VCPPGRGRRPGPASHYFSVRLLVFYFIYFVLFPFILFYEETAPDHECQFDGVLFMIWGRYNLFLC
jgi:hypothetical protein